MKALFWTKIHIPVPHEHHRRSIARSPVFRAAMLSDMEEGKTVVEELEEKNQRLITDLDSWISAFQENEQVSNPPLLPSLALSRT